MGAKMGRPTDSPKDTIVKVRMDKETVAMLDECTEKLDATRSEVIRTGIRKVYDSLDKENKNE